MCGVLNPPSKPSVLPRTGRETRSGHGRIAVRSGKATTKNSQERAGWRATTTPTGEEVVQKDGHGTVSSHAPQDATVHPRPTSETHLAHTTSRTESPVNAKGPTTAHRHIRAGHTRPACGAVSAVRASRLVRMDEARTWRSAATPAPLTPTGSGIRDHGVHTVRVTQ